ncbi:hypothetical protein HK107_06950 [Parvularcula sp. ZS-1/3]|uniref:Bacterial Pleckstrin homology domain-containing protein n=1 Tax=Parvularcula mediterranea TaxID=2732508 RepID=A0A7Y3W589_9PROT|nr:PH domain-containing protein [Parvularcula mediterranea]NNU16057.1 hypothetical protein [Parvularcula mediterranea]
MRFEAASLDTSSRILTPLTVLIALFLLVFPTFVGGSGDLPERVTQALGLVILLISLAAWGAIPKAFEVGEEGLLLETPLGGSRLAWDGIVSARTIERRELPLIRVMGSGGVFGHWGLFRAAGQIVMVRATRRHPAVLIERQSGRPLLVSPKDAEGLAAAITAKAGRASSVEVPA